MYKSEVVSVLLTATYSLAGTELVGLTSRESAGDQRWLLPEQIQRLVWRIAIFYMPQVTILGFCLFDTCKPTTKPTVVGHALRYTGQKQNKARDPEARGGKKKEWG
ncbi:hypothetical protein, partial [Klebsiella pneumoniae]|uniref:hypothetical protein n=1 Tax=Klebsiella pneumoniae TaxID=573 RepID=UPI001F4A9B90